MSSSLGFGPDALRLLDESFDAGTFVKGTIESRESERVLSQLEAGLQLVGKELGGKVSEKYETLLSNVHATHAVEAKLLRSNERIEALAQAVRRIRAQSATPYSRLQASVAQLERMQESAELLRQVQRFVVLSKRLHESMAPPPPRTRRLRRSLLLLLVCTNPSSDVYTRSAGFLGI